MRDASRTRAPLMVGHQQYQGTQSSQHLHGPRRAPPPSGADRFTPRALLIHHDHCRRLRRRTDSCTGGCLPGRARGAHRGEGGRTMIASIITAIVGEPQTDARRTIDAADISLVECDRDCPGARGVVGSEPGIPRCPVCGHAMAP